MQTRDQKIVQYLWEAHAVEMALTRTLQAHVAVTPRGEYRDVLERHLGETEAQAKNIEERLGELGEGRNPLAVGYGLIQSITGQLLALSKTPLDLVRGNSNEERLLKNAKDEAATEALEIATYDSLEQLANRAGDRVTAKLAADHRAQEERMLEDLRRLIPALTDDAIRRDVQGIDRYDETTIGAADAARAAGREAQKTAERSAAQARATAKRATEGARKGAGRAAKETGKAARESGRAAGGAASTARKGAGRAAKQTAETARRAPGVERAEGQVRGAAAKGSDLPIARYDDLNADEVVKKLPDLTQRELSRVEGYERTNQSRSTVLERIEQLRGDEPWRGYDEMTVAEVRKRISDTDDHDVRVAVRDYERRHRNRKSIVDAAAKEITPATS